MSKESETMSTKIRLTNIEAETNYTRVHWAEMLMEQLPDDHNGRNSWLINYGRGQEANRNRDENGFEWSSKTQSNHQFKIYKDPARRLPSKGEVK